MPEKKVSDMLTVVVTGGRDFKNKKLVWRTLTLLMSECRYLELVNGGCPTGADKHARDWASCHKLAGFVTLITVRPEWIKHGKAAGPIRNREMLEEYIPDFVLAFPGERGTAGCIKIARELGIKVREVKEDELL